MNSQLSPKQQFREYCAVFTNIIRKVPLPEFPEESQYESVLIEFRMLPHLEFLIRNTIVKLGNKWCHTVVCGTGNVDEMSRICQSISPKIKVIKLQYENLEVHEYTNLLCSKGFWNLFKSEKILIYQEDTCIFENNMNDFLIWDYVGASWPPRSNHNIFNVGNGGFSLRTRQVMLDAIEKAPSNGILPEDVYFTQIIAENKLGKIPPSKVADLFSAEYKYNERCVGSHCFFLYHAYWKEIIYVRLIQPYMQLGTA